MINPVFYLELKMKELIREKELSLSNKRKIHLLKLIGQYRRAIKILNENDYTNPILRDQKDRSKIV